MFCCHAGDLVFLTHAGWWKLSFLFIVWYFTKNSFLKDAIAKYKSLPDELESMKFVLEMKNTEVKKLRISNAELQHQVICLILKSRLKNMFVRAHAIPTASYEVDCAIKLA